MTRKQFKKRWNSNDDGGGITFDDIADCAREWGLDAAPRTQPMDKITKQVLKAAGVRV